MKKRKILHFGVVVLFLCTTLTYAEADITNEPGNDSIIEEIPLSFSQPTTKQHGDFLLLSIENTEQHRVGDKVPTLPVKQIQLEYPFGTKIINIDFQHTQTQSITLPKKIAPTTEQIPYGTTKHSKNSIFNEEIYSSEAYYPTEMMNYDIKVGRNKNNIKTTYVIINIYPTQYSPMKNEITYITNGEVTITYEEAKNFPKFQNQDLLIITAPAYKDELQQLKTHKENHGISSTLVSTDEITTNGADLQEKIKKYIYEQDSPYVLLVGGYRDFFGRNKPELQLPLRWVDYTFAEAGFVSDLYYADTTYYNEMTDTYEFDDWDSNGNGKYGESSWTAYDDLDLMPDVALGRLACRSEEEVNTMINKIITYENTDNTNENWFKRIMTATGDDFQDITEWNINWDTNGLNGEYTIHAQTTNCNGIKGNEHTVTVSINHGTPSNIDFSEKDHEITDREYPYDKPIAYITVPSAGNTLGNTDVEINAPRGAYDGDRWTPIIYKDRILGIKGKAYDPRTQGGENPDRTNTSVHVWVTKSGEIIKDWTQDSSCWFEGEHQAQLALDYFPTNFEKKKVWTSNGGLHGLEVSELEPEESPKVNGVKSMREALNQGCGFLYVCGHASPISWADHYPGIPGGRSLSDVAGFKVVKFPRSISDLKELFPMNEINNGNKLPIAVVSGCHPLALDCSLMKALYDYDEVFGYDYGKFGPESLGWWLTRLDTGGSIATMGPTGLGFGASGAYCDQGAGTRFWSEGFFRIYNEENMDTLGDVFRETQNYYINTYSPLGDVGMQTILEMVLLGDPTLKIGGYSSSSNSLSTKSEKTRIHAEPLTDQFELKSTKAFSDICVDSTSSFSSNTFQVTTNQMIDEKPETFTTNGAGSFIAGYARELDTHAGGVMQNGFAVSEGGVEWTELLLPNGHDKIVHQDISYSGVDKKAIGVDYNAIGSNHDIIHMNDITDPQTWEVQTWYIPSGDIYDFGRNGVGVAAGYKDDEVTYHACFPANTTDAYDNLKQVPVFSSSYSNYIMWFPSLEHATNVDMEAIHSSDGSIFAFQNPDGGYLGHIEIIGGEYGIDIVLDQELSFINPDIDAHEDSGIAVYQTNNGVKSVVFDGLDWGITQTVTMDGEKPEVVANTDGSYDCYYLRNDELYKKHGEPGNTIPIEWGNEEQITGISDMNTDDMFDAVESGVIYPKTDGNLYFNGELTTIQSLNIIEIESDGTHPIATIKNTGTTTINDQWSIQVVGTNPLAKLGIPDLIKGRVFEGDESSGTLNLDVGDTTTIEGDTVRGIGYCDVIVTIGDESKTEDGFMLLDSFILHHPRE